MMTSFRTILVAADFSARSREAFRLACSLAEETKTRVFVVHVIESMPVAEQPIAFGELGVPVPVPGGDQAHHDALLGRLREVYVPNRPIDVSYRVADGLPAEELLRQAREVGADLIALGTHGRTGLRRLLAGSVAEAVLRGASCPVIALRSTAEPARELPEISTIVCPTDFSESSEAAIGVARTLAGILGTRLVVLHVAPNLASEIGAVPVPVDPRYYHDALREIRERIDGPELKVPVETELRLGDPAEEVLQAAEEVGAGLIVLGSHGRTALGRLLMGSVAESVMRRSPCPVLIIKATRSAAPRPDPVPAATA